MKDKCIYLREVQEKECAKRNISYPFFRQISEKWPIEIFATRLIEKLDLKSFRDICVGYYPTEEFNATIAAPNDKPIIIICWGLPLILGSLNPFILQGIKKRDMSIFFNTMVTCACAIRFGYCNFSSKLQLPKSLLLQRNVINQMIDSQIAFLLLHEYSHFLLGHDYYEVNTKEELEADCKAITLLDKVIDNKDDCYSSLYLLLELMMMFDVMFPDIHPSDSHPPASDRWREISKTWACKNSLQLRTVSETAREFAELKSHFKSEQQKDPNFVKFLSSIRAEKCDSSHN